MNEKKETIGIILAAGSGKRFGGNKLLTKLNRKPVISYSLEEFEKSQFIDNNILVCSESNKSELKKMIEKQKFLKIKKIINGGKTRQESVFNALEHIKSNGYNCKYVIIHDGARPLITYKEIDQCIQGAVKYKASSLGIRPKDTIKQSDSPYSKLIISTPPRELLWIIQTPQAFEYDLLYENHLKAIKNNFQTTDDCAIVENSGINPYIIEGSYKNIKITTPEDIKIAKVLMQ